MNAKQQLLDEMGRMIERIREITEEFRALKAESDWIVNALPGTFGK